jgi:hypothetical protein
MKLQALKISILGSAILGILSFQQDSPELNNSVQNIAQADTANEQASINTAELTQRLPAEVQVEHIQIQPNDFDDLSNGQKIAIYIPQEQQDYIGTVEQNHQQFDGQVQVSTGSINNGQQFSSFTVTKGSDLTLVMVATGEKIYQIEINNKTGAGTVIDDQSLDHFRKHDDSRATPPEGIS